MGLDIYVRWDDMTKEESDAQITGFTDAVEVGHLRFNWTGVKLCRLIAEATGAPNPIRSLWGDWNGFNGEDLLITDDEMQRLRTEQKRISDWISANVATMTLPNFPEEDPVELKEWFIHKLNAATAMIAFVESNIGKPGLQIQFD